MASYLTVKGKEQGGFRSCELSIGLYVSKQNSFRPAMTLDSKLLKTLSEAKVALSIAGFPVGPEEPATEECGNPYAFLTPPSDRKSHEKLHSLINKILESQNTFSGNRLFDFCYSDNSNKLNEAIQSLFLTLTVRKVSIPRGLVLKAGFATGPNVSFFKLHPFTLQLLAARQICLDVCSFPDMENA